MALMSEDRKSRANWVIDKVLLGLCAFLVLQSYKNINDSIEVFSKDINELKTTTRLLEYRVAQIEKQ